MTEPRAGDAPARGFDRLLQKAHAIGKEVLAACAEVSALSGGYFTVRPGGRFDPSGYVKGWAIERAAAMLTAAGSAEHSVNGGGDIQCVGDHGPGQPWRVGIADPLRPGSLALLVTGQDFAVAQDLLPQTLDEQTVLSYTAQVPASLMKEFFLTGTPQEVIDQAAHWRDHGLRYLVVMNLSILQPSLRNGMAANAPFLRILRGLKKL